jgi:translation initiation factor IF-1
MPKRNRKQQSGSPTGEELREDRLVLEGQVAECLPGTLFKVKCEQGNEALCTLSGKLRVNRIRILPGDNVTIELSPYDLSRGRITWRHA